MAELVTTATFRLRRLWPPRSMRAPAYTPTGAPKAHEELPAHILTAGELIAMARNARNGRITT